MRLLAAFLLVGVVVAAPVRADDGRLAWPLRPPPTVLREFDAPAPDWLPGHRGVDLAGTVDEPVYAPAPGTVVFAGQVAGKPVVSVEHAGGLRTSYEPVRATVRAGSTVGTGTPLGELVAGHPGCGAAACLHWGAMWGPSSRADYVDPIGLLASTRVRLKPLQR